jgi:hypothetical protein
VDAISSRRSAVKRSPYAARGIAAYEVRLALKVLRGFYEFGAARLAFRDQPLPSKPVIPMGGDNFPGQGACPTVPL